MRIDDSGHTLQIVRQLAGKRIGFGTVRTGYPDVDRRRLTEIQHLIDDVGRLEKELQLRKTLRQLAPQLRDHELAVGVCFGFSETRISPSIGPTVAESLNAIFMPLYGRPMLSRMVSI